ncbi:MAG: cyclic nucleotide-binding domain-containing protein [Acidobacteriota bacterium]|nr:cyclic nucleotide-binding domain-containing protein [Acidobacteriota bacterium]
MNQFSVVEQVGCWPAGSLLFREGEAPAGIFVIHSGTVDLVFSARNGMTKPLRKLHAGDVAGLSDAVSNTPHDCTATTRTAARIGFVPITELRHLLDQQPAMWFAIAELLSADVNACWGSMRSLAAGR